MLSSLGWGMMWSDMILVASYPARFTLRMYLKFTRCLRKSRSTNCLWQQLISSYLWPPPEWPPPDCPIDAAWEPRCAPPPCNAPAREVGFAYPPRHQLEPPICGVCSFVLANPPCCTDCESRPRLLILPRGIPSPAELLGISSLLNDLPNGVGIGPRFTVSIRCPEFGGGCEIRKCAGAFSTLGVPHPTHEPPGCQAHPRDGRNTHEP